MIGKHEINVSKIITVIAKVEDRKYLQTFFLHYQTWDINKDWKVLPFLVHDVIFMHDRHFLTPDIFLLKNQSQRIGLCNWSL